MSLETASTIAQLQSSAPSASDPMNQGDDHIRMIKHVLKNIFPGSGGQGFSVPITATEAEINHLDGVTGNIQAQLSSLQSALSALLGTLPAPIGTRLTFFQSAPPAGWSLVTDYDNYMLRVVSTVGGGFGGSDSPILNNKVPSHTHAANSVVTDPGHTHTVTSVVGSSGGLQFVSGSGVGFYKPTAETNTTGISVSTTVSANSGASNWTPKYLDMVIGQKS